MSKTKQNKKHNQTIKALTFRNSEISKLQTFAILKLKFQIQHFKLSQFQHFKKSEFQTIKSPKKKEKQKQNKTHNQTIITFTFRNVEI